MPDWKALCTDVQTLRKSICHFPEGLDADYQAYYAAHNAAALTYLQNLLQADISDVDKEMHLRTFLFVRGNAVINSSIDYTLNPRFPSNYACLKIAHAIAKPNDSVVKMLMPTISQVIGSFPPEDVKEGTEDENDVFNPWLYRTNAKSNALLSTFSIYEAAIHNADLLFDANAKHAFLLTGADHDRLRNSYGKKGEQLFNALRQRYLAAHNQKMSVGFVLKELKDACLKASVQGSGGEYHSDNAESWPGIRNFHKLWVTWPEAKKSEIGAYKADGATENLEQYLLFLFFDVPDLREQFSEEENKKLVEIRQFHCIHIIGQQLQRLLEHNPSLHEMPLTPEGSMASSDQAVSPDALCTLESLKEQCEQLRESDSFVCSIGAEDERCVRNLDYLQLLLRCMDQHDFNLLDRMGAVTIEYIVDHETFLTATLLRPAECWSTILPSTDEIDDVLCETLFSVSSIQYYIAQLFPLLAPEQKKEFFSVFAPYMAMEIGVEDLYDIYLSESSAEKKALIKVMEPLIAISLIDGHGVVKLFATRDPICYEDIANVFKPYLLNVLSDPPNFSTFFNAIRQPYHALLLGSFGDEFLEKIMAPGQLVLFIGVIKRGNRLPLIRDFGHHFSDALDHWYELSLIMGLLQEDEHANLLKCVRDSKKAELVPDVRELIKFLRHSKKNNLVILESFSEILPALFSNLDDVHQAASHLPDLTWYILLKLKNKLPGLALDSLNTFSSSAKSSLPIEDKLQSQLNFFIERAMPVIFADDFLKQFACGGLIRPVHGRFFSRRKNTDYCFRQTLSALFENAHHDAIEQAIALFKCVKDFVAENNDGSKSRICPSLIGHFGKDFFDHLSLYLDMVYLPSRRNTGTTQQRLVA